MATEATQTQATNTAATEEKITFTPEQQKRVDEILRESMGRAAREVRLQNEELSTRVQTLQSEIEAAKADLGKAKTPTEKKEAKAEAEALTLQIQEMKAIQSQNAAEMERLKQVAASKDKDVEAAKKEALNIRKTNAIQSVAAQHGFVDIDVVTHLTADAIQYDSDSGKFFVVGENGQPRLNSAYEQMSLDEYFQEFATKKPYLVRSDVKGGAGSTEAQRSALNQMGKYTLDQIFGKNSNPVLANKLAISNNKEYKRMRAEAVEKGII